MPIEHSYEKYASSMGGFQCDESYASKEDFFNKHFLGMYYGRLVYHYDFVRHHLKPPCDILSIGSGRCTLELKMLEDGYNVTCSDIRIPECWSDTKRIFPRSVFLEHDILKTPTPKQYDAIISFAVMYLFDSQNLQIYFRNVSASLKNGGHLIIDAGSAPDNIQSYLFHDGFLRYEAEVARLITFLKGGTFPAFVKEHVGYRRTDAEIIQSASESGFVFVDKAQFAYAYDLRRSYFLNKLLPNIDALEHLLRVFNIDITYLRLFDFKKQIQ